MEPEFLLFPPVQGLHLKERIEVVFFVLFVYLAFIVLFFPWLVDSYKEEFR